MRLLAIAVVLSSSSSALAFSQFTRSVPNGGTIGCLTCHTRSSGGEGWNDFGKALLIAGGANPEANPSDQNLNYDGSNPSEHWLAVCPSDSDGDGATNGEELGDPDCQWSAGDANPAVDASNPGDPESAPDSPGGGGDGDGGGGDGDSAGGCAAAGVPSAAVLGALAFALRRRRT